MLEREVEQSELKPKKATWTESSVNLIVLKKHKRKYRRLHFLNFKLYILGKFVHPKIQLSSSIIYHEALCSWNQKRIDMTVISDVVKVFQSMFSATLIYISILNESYEHISLVIVITLGHQFHTWFVNVSIFDVCIQTLKLNVGLFAKSKYTLNLHVVIDYQISANVFRKYTNV